jgi:putative ABC transport system permease protein
MRHLIPDVSFSFRLARRHPVETALAVVAIVLGVGLSTAMFSILWGTVLRGLPFKDSERLARIEWISNGERVAPSDVDFAAWRRSQRSFEGVAAWIGSSFNLTIPGETAERCNGAFVSANTFQLIQVPPILGRDFRAEDEALNAPMVAIVSARLWKNEFHRSPDVLGKLIKLNGQSAQVIGVMPEGFGFPLSQELWTPLQLNPKPMPQGQELRAQVFGKLKRGVSFRQAAANLQAISAQDPAKRNRSGVAVTPFVKAYTEDLQPTLYLLFGASLGLLLVVCANVSGLLTAQVIARLPELAVRSAVGATRSRLLLQLVAETAVLSLVGTALSVPLAAAAIHTYIASQGGELRSFWMDVRLDTPVVAYAFSITILVIFISTAIPAIQVTGPRLNEVLKRGAGKDADAAGGAASGFRLVLQLALSFSLLVATGSIIASFGRLGRLDFGFAPARVLSSQLLVPYDSYPSLADKVRFLNTLEGHLEGVVGPGRAAFASALPGNAADEAEVTIEGQPPLAPGTPQPLAQTLTVSRNYFALLHITAFQGRVLDARDRADGPPAAVVNRSFARRFFGDASPLGARVRLGSAQEDSPWRTIVGVVPDFVIGKAPAPHPEGIYLPLEQKPSGWMAVLLRTPSSPLRFTKALKRSIAATDPEVPTFWVETLQERSDAARRPLKTMAQVFLTLGTAALFLSLLGIYGVTSRNVSSRSGEMAVRLILGARKVDLLRLVLRGTFLQVVAGIVLGGLLSVGTSRFLAALLYDFQGWEPGIFLGVAALLTLVGMLACLVPAAAVLRLQPADTLRER